MSSNMRGIIISPPFDFDGKVLTILKGRIDAVDLREYLLYWDKIDFPVNNVIKFEPSPDDKFLIDTGIMSRTKIFISSISPMNLGDALVIAQAKALEHRNKEEPGQWTMAQSGSKIFLPAEISKETKSIEFELYNALPVPSQSVALDDILQFKEKRRDELLAFRVAMDQLYLEVINSRDIPRAKIVALSKLELTLEDLHKVSNESWTSKMLSSLKVELNMPELVSNAFLGAAVAPVVLGVSSSLGAAIGAGLAAFKFDLTATRIANGLPPELKDFAYLHRIENELNT